MAQEIGLLARLLDAGAVLLQGLPRLPDLPRRLGDGLDLGAEAAEGVENGPVRDGIDQGAVVVLAVDFDEGRADRPQHLHAHRLVVDEGAGAPVRDLHAAQNQVAVDIDIGLGRDPAGRMVGGQSNTAVTWPWSSPWRTRLPSPRPPRARAKASSRIDLPAPVSPVRTLTALMELKLEPVDEDDVADRQLDQHGG